MIQKMLQKMKHFVKAFLAKNKVYLNAPCILITRRKIIKKNIYIKIYFNSIEQWIIKEVIGSLKYNPTFSEFYTYLNLMIARVFFVIRSGSINFTLFLMHRVWYSKVLSNFDQILKLMKKLTCDDSKVSSVKFINLFTFLMPKQYLESPS